MKWAGIVLMVIGFGGCVSALQLERQQAATSETAALVGVLMPLAVGIAGLVMWLRTKSKPPA